MAGLFDKQAEVYANARPKYPSHWYSMLANRTAQHHLVWDVGTGNGQAAIGVAEHYKQVIGTDISEQQIKHALPHPKVHYIHTPPSISDDELVSLLGGEDSVDLITVAQAVHWFDLPKFYSLVTRLLRKPGGVFAVWGYNNDFIFPGSSPQLDSAIQCFHATTLPFWNSGVASLFDGYRELHFPFESVGLGSEGEPLLLDMQIEWSFEGLLGMLRSWSAVNTAKARGVDLLPAHVVQELQAAWGGSDLIRPVIYKAFMLAGTPKQQ